MMDDDGHPEDASCLAELLKTAEEHQLDIVSPLVAATADPNRLSFNFRINGLLTNDRSRLAPMGYLPDMVHFFNGALIRTEVFYKIGIPDVKFFIRGDEVDFLSRVKKAGLKYGTLATVAVQHPATWTEMKPVFGGFITPVIPEGEFKRYCYFRNRGYLTRKYRNLRWFGADIVGFPYYFLKDRRPQGPGALVQRLFHRLPRQGLRLARAADVHRHARPPWRTCTPSSSRTTVPTSCRTCWIPSPGSSTGPERIIVVDNASTDHTADVVARARPPAGRPSVYERLRGERRRRRRLLPRRRAGAGIRRRMALADGRRRRGAPRGGGGAGEVHAGVLLPDRTPLRRQRQAILLAAPLRRRTRRLPAGLTRRVPAFRRLPHQRRQLRGHADQGLRGAEHRSARIRASSSPGTTPIYGWLAAQQTPVVYVNAFVIKKVRAQRQVDLGLRHLNDSSDLSRRYVMRNRGHVAQYLKAHGRFSRTRVRGRDGLDVPEGNGPPGTGGTDPEGDRGALAGMAGITRYPGR